MTTEKQTSYSFTNPNLGACFKLHGISITTLDVHSTLVIFSVPKTEQVLKIIEDFNNDCPVPVKSFVSALQEVKKGMYALRGTTR